MREISFRGKRVDNGEWIYGDLWKYPYGKNKICIVSFFDDTGTTGGVEVIPETVGQYTGLTDKNGKKIFEDDILRQRTTEYFKKFNDFEWEKYGVVCFGEYDWDESNSGYCSVGWYVNPIKSFAINPPDYNIGSISAGLNQGDICDKCHPYEVIGNIHDNPEWLKV